MPQFHLHLITDRPATPDLPAAVAAALNGGVNWVQVREKSAPALDLYEMALALGRLCRPAGAGLLVNDRVDVTLAAGAAGVHLARRSLPVAPVRALLPPGRLLGVSVHNVDEALAAAAAGADYVTFGSIYPTRSHPGMPAQGLVELARVVAAIPVPVLAVGGITLDNLEPVLATGVAGVALISAVLLNSDPRQAAAAIRTALDRSRSAPRHPFPTPGAPDLHPDSRREES